VVIKRGLLSQIRERESMIRVGLKKERLFYINRNVTLKLI